MLDTLIQNARVQVLCEGRETGTLPGRALRSTEEAA